MRRGAAIMLAAGVLMSLAGCGWGQPERTEGVLVPAAECSPDAVVATVDGRDLPAWQYLTWLIRTCDGIRADVEERGEQVDWTMPLGGRTLGEYAADAALESAALYTTVEAWAEEYGVELTQEDRTALAEEWQRAAEDHGGEAAYLAHLAGLGLERRDAEQLAEVGRLYRRLGELAAREDSELWPGRAALADCSREMGLCTLDAILLTPTAPEGLDTCRRQAEELLGRVRASSVPGETFALLAETRRPAGFPRTIRQGDDTLPEDLETAAETLEEGYCTDVLPWREGFALLLRLPTDETAAAEAWLDGALEQAVSQAVILRKSRFYDLDPGVFYPRFTALRRGSASGAGT